MELNILNSLIGSRNIEEEFKNILIKYPDTMECIPLLLAVRSYEIFVKDDMNEYVFKFDSMNYSIEDYIKFMRNSGLTVHLKGFDKYNRPIVDIDGVIHTADKNGTLGLSQRFITAKHQISILENSERYNNIIKLLA